jgi:hypothetical protein
VLGSEFICTQYRECRASHAATFHEGQLHHLGRFYDLLFNGVPLRVVVVGQEYGHEPPRVGSQARYEMIMHSGIDCRFSAEGEYKSRNPHMRGTTSALRLLFGLPLGADHEREFLQIDRERVHLFDAFGLINYLLCSAVGDDGKTRGLATKIMKKNCQSHFREALRILEPSVIIVQGKTFWRRWIRSAFDSVEHREHEVYAVRLGRLSTLVASFTHPSARYPYNWGTNDNTPYLLHTVAPSIAWIRSYLFRGR